MKHLFGLCLLLLGSAQLPAQETGRLFHTPAERAQLDAEKYRLDPAHAPAPRYQGVVRRSQGPATIWINGVPQEGQPPVAPPVGSPAASGSSPGDPLLQGGRIVVHPPRNHRSP